MLAENKDENVSQVNNDSGSDYEDIDGKSNTNFRTMSISASMKDTEKFLMRMDDDLQKICQSVSNREPDLEHVTKKLTTQCIRPRNRKNETEELGSVWSGCGWKSAVAVFIFVAIVLPLIYFIYVEKFKS